MKTDVTEIERQTSNEIQWSFYNLLSVSLRTKPTDVLLLNPRKQEQFIMLLNYSRILHQFLKNLIGVTTERQRYFNIYNHGK